MYDLKIVNGKIIDLDANGFIDGDIGIKDGKIVDVGNCPSEGKNTIDAKGKIVSPGFIDIHMHEEKIGYSTDGDDYDIANNMIKMGATTCVAGNCGNNRQSVEEFFDFINKNGSPVNYLSALGHNYLREMVGIDNRYRHATKMEIQKMQDIVKESIGSGIIGISFGLEYSPGVEFEEVIELCRPLKGDRFLISAHYRKDAKYGIKSIDEMIEISKITGLPMQISHLGSCTAYGMMKESLEVIQKAIDDGVDVKADCYPYDAFSTKIGSAVFDEGCLELWNKSYNDILLTETPYKGMRCDENMFYDARENHPEMLAVAFVMNEDEVIEAIKAPFVMVASDGIYNRGQGHPRGAGTFPRVLGRFVREQEALSLIEAVRKMTSMPAKRLGLKSKGKIKPEFDADIVIFNQDTIIDGATFENPTLPPNGIDYVIVNGQIAVKENKIINGRIGRVIKREEL
ncbi:N-acyl-D-amino-acid deacylase family protein [Clostridiisalibacter paucivorans]|uniref:N-acyl-D-amino-acid deacylase family protein n=1 Tax=Clostridiisalibacter paucivorans TaxID=408753 RepID=UPI000478953A|nr:amidohydrolase family protein [Clostridiisalibacter paucivorans]